MAPGFDSWSTHEWWTCTRIIQLHLVDHYSGVTLACLAHHSSCVAPAGTRSHAPPHCQLPTAGFPVLHLLGTPKRTSSCFGLFVGLPNPSTPMHLQNACTCICTARRPYVQYAY